MNISTVNELITSLESAGELSIKERKYLELAKAYLVMAAENVVLKESRKNLAEFIHEELDADYPLSMNLETPATDAYLAGIKADGVDYVAHKFRVRAQNSLPVGGWIDAARAAEDFAQQLREGAK